MPDNAPESGSWVKFRNTAEAILGIGAKYIFPVVASLVPVLNVPRWAAVLVTNVVPALMAAAETMNNAPGAGPAKKSQVMEAAAGMMAVLEKTFTGGAKGNFDLLRPTLEILIDRTVAMVNDLAPEIIQDDPLLDPSHPANQP